MEKTKWPKYQQSQIIMEIILDYKYLSKSPGVLI